MNSSRKRPGLLFTLVAPAGAGKNSLMEYVLGLTPLHQLPTVTTRPMRPDEQQGREHHFVSEEEFRRLIERGDLLEYQVIHGNLYGMPRAAVEAALDNGEYIIADIELYGAARARAIYPENVVSIFIQAPSIGSLIQRMQERGEREAEIGKRLLRVPVELAYARECDFAIMNDSFADAANKLYEIVSAQLRGERSTAGDPLIEYRFTYFARIVPMCGNLALRSNAHAFEPQAQFSDPELPHQAALRALRDALPLNIREDALIGGDKPDGSYLPPVRLLYTHDESGECITYVYYYRLEERTAAPAGWTWVGATPLAEPVARRSEA